MEFTKDILKIDCAQETEKICAFIKKQAYETKKDGAVIGVSGGVDSAVSLSLLVKTFGKEKVMGLILPEKNSNPISAEYARKQAEKLGVKTELIDMTPVLEAMGTYKKIDAVIKEIFPEYNDKCRIKITLPPDLLNKDAYNFFTLVMDDGNGNIKKERLNKNNLNSIVAATCTKHRIRMTHLYYFAEKNNYFVCGTTNKTELLEGDFVKYGDGGVDIEPLAHLYKLQVYQLAEYLGVIKEIIERAPSPDTFSFPVSDEEFYFRLPFNVLDPLLFAWENKIGISRVSETLALKEDQIQRAFRDFTAKFNTTKHLRQMPPML